MPAIRQKRIFRDDLLNNPKVLYLFGDNEKRAGLGGQAKEMRGEANALGVRTKAAPSMEESAFWSDSRADLYESMIDEDLWRAFDHVQRGGILVIPADGLGTGFSQLPERAPIVNRYLKNQIERLLAY